MDGVPNAEDRCPDTPLCAEVDEVGCPDDADGDAVVDGCDQCEDTPTGETVYADGCSVVRDGVPSRCQGPDPRTVEIEYYLVILFAGCGVITAALWGGMVIWAFRDMRARSRDILAQILGTVLVAVLPIVGFMVYLMLRPQETLADTYERSLEQEALLQAIEEPEVCPGCGQRVRGEYLFCPSCHTRLKRPCPSCNQAMHLRWALCPYCGMSVTPQVLEPVPEPEQTQEMAEQPAE